MEFSILGPLEVRADGRAVPLGAAKPRSLLAVLLLHANQVVSSDRLIDELWGEAPPATVAKSIHVYVSGLRKQLGDGILVTRAPGYLLRVEPHRARPRALRGARRRGRWRAPETAASGSARRSSCGADRRWPTSRSSRSHRPTSPGWRSSACPRRSSGSTPSSRQAATPRSPASSRRSPACTRCESGCRRC